LQFGADPNIRNAQGETALLRAQQHSLDTIVQRLLNCGARTS
jgi:ankyrin repeat protein